MAGREDQCNVGIYGVILLLVLSAPEHIQMKKVRSERRKHCALAKVEPKIFVPPQTLFPGSRDGQNLISWRWSLPLPTNPVW